MVIAGNPAGVHAAAAALGRVGSALDDTARAVGRHGETATAQWYGSASAAASEAIHALRTATYSVADAVAACERVYATYADELAAAQNAWLAGQQLQADGEAGQRAAADAALAADVRGVDDPGRGPAVAAARAAGERAGARAEEGRTAMDDAVAREVRANEAAAGAVEAIADRLDDVAAAHPAAAGSAAASHPPAAEATGAAGGWDGGRGVHATMVMGLSALPGPGDPERPTSVPPGDDAAEIGRWWHDAWWGRTPDDEADNRHSVLYDQLGGLGNGAWNAVPGAVGKLLAGSPYGWVRAGSAPITKLHGTLESWYDADTGSEAYRENSEVGELAAGIVVPGPGGKGKLLDDVGEGVVKKGVLDSFPPPPSGPASATWGRAKTLQQHVVDHGSDFGVTDPEEYARLANEFRKRADDPGIQIKIESTKDKNVVRLYDPSTNTFGSYNGDGTTKTIFKPPAGQAYFDRQDGALQ